MIYRDFWSFGEDPPNPKIHSSNVMIRGHDFRVRGSSPETAMVVTPRSRGRT